jgi:pyruvate dehydrogenase (quinone)
VCAGSCGPDNTHLLQGLYDAHRSGAPVLALASHIPSEQIGTGYFQETHPERLFVECSHFCELLSRPAQMPRMARTAIQHATGLGGVAVLVVPGDVAHQPAVHATGRTDTLLGPAPVVPRAEQVQALAEAMNTARTVTLFCGAGTRGAHAEVMELAGRLQAPIGHTPRGKDWIQFDNPFDVGMTGLLGYGACYQAMHEADLLLLLGTDFPYDTFLPQAHTIQIDRDPARLGRRTPLELAVHGDVRETLRAVLPQVEQKTVPPASRRPAWTSRANCTARSAPRWGTTAPTWSTSSPTPTRCPSRPTSPRPRSGASPWRAARSCSRAASAR